MRSCNIISFFAQPVSTLQEPFQMKSYKLNSFFLIVTLFHNMDIPRVTHPFSCRCTLQVFLDSPLLAMLQYITQAMLPYVLVLSFLQDNQLSMLNLSCVHLSSGILLLIVYPYLLPFFLQLPHQFVRTLYILQILFIDCHLHYSLFFHIYLIN